MTASSETTQPWPQIGMLHIPASGDTRTVFVAGRPGWLLTAAHNLPADVDFHCLFPHAAAKKNLTVVARHAFTVGDIAVLKVRAEDHALLPAPLRLDAEYKPREGDHYSTWGFRSVASEELVLLSAEGDITGLLPTGLDNSFPVFQLRTDTQRPGMSGAPIVADRLHAVIGVGIGRRYTPDPGDQEPLAFAQPLDTLPLWLWREMRQPGTKRQALTLMALISTILLVSVIALLCLLGWRAKKAATSKSPASDSFRSAAVQSGRPQLFDTIWMHVIYDPSRLPQQFSLQSRIFYAFEVLRPSERFDEAYPLKDNLTASITWSGTDSFDHVTKNPNPNDYDVLLPKLAVGDHYALATGMFRTYDWAKREQTAFGPDGPRLPVNGEWAGYPNREDYIRELIISVEAPTNRTTGYAQIFRGKPDANGKRKWDSEELKRVSGGKGAPDMYVARTKNVMPGEFLGIVFEFNVDSIK